jgi:hypothetical protein
MKSSQRLTKLRHRAGVRQYGTYISQCLGDADANRISSRPIR